MTYRPELTQARCAPTFTVEARNEHGEIVPTEIAAERPLTLYVDKREIVTLMTLGGNPEALALGYLRNQRLVENLEDIVAVHADWEVGAVAVTTRHGLADLDGRMAKRTVTTGCGQGTVFGALMEDIENIRLRDDVRLDEAVYYQLIDNIRRHETVYKQAGAVHGCALAQGAEILLFVEDVGRHNAVDAIAGRMWLDAIDGSDKVFYTTGRLTSEMVIKSAQMGVPIVISRSGITQMGHAVAQRLNLCAIGRATNKRFLCFSAPQRLVLEAGVAGERVG